MKIYLVIYIAGLVNSSAGPLPITMAECTQRAPEWSVPIMAEFAAQGFQAEVRCEWHKDHPEAGTAKRARS